MSKKLIYFVLVLSFCLASSLQAATIIWVSDDKNHNTVVATGAADQGWVDLLRTYGYTVDYRGEDGSTNRRHWRDMNNAKVAELNAADLVIVSRDISSGSYDQPEDAYWNAVTTPLILQIAHLARSGDEWFWLPGSGTSARFNPLVAVVPGHDIFDGVSLDGSNQVDILITKGSTDLRVDVASGATDAGNGTVLAKTGDNLVWIAIWEAGQEFYAASGQTAGGPRMWFAGGSTDSQDGEYNFNAEGEKLFINAVRYMLGETGGPGQASNPNPADEATDVPRDAVLRWTQGEYAPAINGHKVYISESFNDVNDGIAGITQSLSSYVQPQRLDFNTTYYWRVDEVNSVSGWDQGDVWSFTTELLANPIDGNNIIATASSTSQPDMGPENTINGSGLDANDLHSTEATDMWLSGNEPNAWIEYEFDKVYKLHEMWVWNSNQVMELILGLGCKDVSIEYSVNGTDYTTLAGVPEFARASGADDYAHNTTVDLSVVTAKYVRLTANSNWGGFFDQYGLSEVRFFSIPVFAREPSPDSGTTDVTVDVTLGFRAGREAAEHNVYLNSDEQAVIDGNAPVTTVAETSYGPLSLDLGTTYYWKINEVNEAETTTTWQGDIWNFSTHEFFVVDDFEDYNDYPPDEIWSTWVDGYGVPTNGATAGYPDPVDFLAGEHYVETAIVHGGDQSMPFFYSNTGTAIYSEGERTFAVPQDWTKAGVQTLALYFYGTPGNTGQLYVKVNGSKVVYDGDASNLARAGWQAWNIELASLGVGLQSVTTLAIGIDDNGASGTLYFDDIRLYSYSRQFITPAEPNNAGLVAHYKLDQDATDSSGNNNHGTLVGSPQWAAGKIGGALDFDGDDYVDFGNPSLLDFGTDSWSISAWINMPASTDQMIIFSNGGDSSGGIRYMLSMGETDDHKAVLTVDDNADKKQSTGSVTVDDDQWHHIVGMRDGSSLRVYVDGVQDGGTTELSDGYDLSGTSQANAYIGAGWNYEDSVVQKYFIGVIDDVRIYDYALSHAEVAWLAGMTLPFDKPF